ncbi:oxidoreductase [Roseateles noduli]|uniref:oxidoreductase n=1 Tax=Roseateles noduli TaxID=2052484 RepID=UPI003D64E19D
MTNQPTILITGVSSGIGLATAKKFVACGSRVFGTVRSLQKATPIAGVELVEMDVRKDASVLAGVLTVIGRAGRVDVLVNNAGVSMIGAVEETMPAEAAALFDTNVLGVLRVSQAVLPHMRERRQGRIINVSSVLGFLPGPYMGLYAASKHAIEGLSESLDHEVRQFGIRVTLVQPSYTKTSLEANSPHAATLINAYDKERQRVTRSFSTNVNGGGDPATVANTIVDAAFGARRMRRPPPGQASLLSKLRRFMPAGPVDKSLRKQLGLG